MANKGSAFAQQASSVALDPRVGANIRLGDDPPALPANMRAQAEPHIARSLTNPDLLAATFQEGRFTDGGAVDCGYSISHDGGLTWSRALLPGVTQITGGPYFRATDPVAGLDLNNRIYLNVEGATDSAFITGIVLVSRSLDGGQAFQPPAVVYRPPDATIFPDKNWMAINTFAGSPSVGRIVVTFTEFFGKFSPIARSFSNDGGVTWSSAAFIHSSTSKAQGSQPVFLPNGKFAIVYWNFGSNGDPAERLEVVTSNDGGVTFAAPKTITHATEFNEPSIRSGGFLPSAATDRAAGSGNIYVVYQTLVAGLPRIVFTKSTNSGTNWSAPITISNNPAGSGVFNPAISASPDGKRLTVAFYDHRANPGAATLVDMYLAQSFDGGATWQPNIRLTSVSTDASLAPLTNAGYMLGDYLGIAESTNANVPAVPIWVDTRTGNPDPFIARVGIAPQVNFTAWQAAHLSLAQINTPGIGGQ
ncbi:MAG TPA: sialidase family protein, partial [Chthoniobacterales bacterium]|nr:sialidase family protein [Chthoniobacterales bacterium]